MTTLLLGLATFAAGFLTCFVLLVWASHRAAVQDQEVRREPTIQRAVIMHVRHDVHHHGLAPDDDGDAWEKG